MKILLISAHFPPYAPAAATRAPKLARFWLNHGADVRVLGTYRPSLPRVLEAGIPDSTITYAPMRDLDAPKEAFKRLVSASSNKAGGASPGNVKAAQHSPSAKSPLRRALKRFYSQVMHYPDKHAGWVKPAIGCGNKILADWRADLIYATAPPHSAFLVASALSARHDIPWIAEYRDAWVTEGYFDAAWYRAPFERRLEKRTLKNAAGIVALTETSAKNLGEFHAKPTAVAMNGFDPADFPQNPVAPLDAQRLTILYAGSIYVGKRDPSPLFAAIAALGADRRRIAVHFYMDQGGDVAALAQRYGVEDEVHVHAAVPHSEILKLERSSDVLLLLRWDDPRERGVIAGKLFEYIGARRPILSVGGVTGEAADIIRQGGFGLVSNDEAQIQAQLRLWIEEKNRKGSLPDLPQQGTEAYTRERQFKRIENFIAKLGLAR